MKKLAILLVLIACLSVMADKIVLKNGSVILGKVTQILSGKLTVSTDFAGDINVKTDDISLVETDADVNVAVADKKSQGKLTISNDQMLLGSTQITPAELTALWPQGADDPTLPKEHKWAYEADVSLSGKTGNTEKTTLGGGLKATKKGIDDRLMFYANGNYARENGNINEQKIIGGADYEHAIVGANDFWYARTEGKHDQPNNFRVQYTLAGGYSRYLLREEDAEIRLRIGPSYVASKYIDEKPSDSSVGLDINYHHEFRIHEFLGFKEFGKLVTDINYEPQFNDFLDKYRLYHESALDIPLGGSPNWSLRLGISNEYHNSVSPDTKKLDTTYFIRLVLNWE